MLQWIVLALALVQGFWLAYDGAHAFRTGNYVTAKSGPHAGELGPWARLIAGTGLDPRSNFVKGLHVFLGIAWLAGVLVFATRPAVGWWIILACSIGSLWYLPLGTLLSVGTMILLFLEPIRNLR